MNKMNKSKRMVLFLMLGIGTQGLMASDYYAKKSASDLSLPESYTDKDGVECRTQPGSGDRILLPEDSEYEIEGSSAAFAVLAGCKQICPGKGAKLKISVTDAADKVRLTAPFFNEAANSEKRTYGTLVKLGDGELVLGPSTAITSSTSGAAYLYSVNADVVKGILRYPENIEVNGYAGNLTVAAGATVFLPKSPSSATQINFNHIYAAAGSLITNDTTRSSAHVLRIAPYPGYASSEDSEIAGTLGGGLRVWSYANVILSGTNNTMTSATTIEEGGSKYHVPGGRGTISVASFDSDPSNGPSSIGQYSAFTIYSTGGGYRYLGSGETVSKTLSLYEKSSIGFVDAGPVGNLDFGVKLVPSTDGNSSPSVRLFHFTGSNRVESVWSGACNLLEDGGVVYPMHLTKSGSGTWRFANNANRNHVGGTTVQEGMLCFDSLAEAGKMCAFGLATLPTANAYDAVTKDRAQFVGYAFTLGGKTSANVPANPILKYTGEESAACHTRPLVLVQDGGTIRNDSASTRLAFFGISARDEGSNPTLTLDGSGTANNTVGDITNGLGQVSVVKRGTGTWTLARELSFSGDLEVKAGTLQVEKANPNYTWFRFTFCEVGTKYYEQNCTVQMRELALYSADGTRHNIGLKPVYPTPYPYAAEAPALDAALDLEPGEVSYARCPDGTLRSYTHESENVSTTTYFDLEGLFSGIGGTSTGKKHKYNIKFDKAAKADTPSTWVPIVMRLTNGVPAITHFDLQMFSNFSNAHTWPHSVICEGSVDGVHWKTIFDNREQPFDLSRTYVVDGETRGLGVSTGYGTYVANLWLSDMMPFTNNATCKRPLPSGYAFSSSGEGQAPSQLQDVRSISVASGATLKAVGGSIELKTLKVDVANAGTVDGFSFPEEGTIEVVGVGADSDIELPLKAVNCTDLDNISGWTVKSGARERPNWSVVNRNGVLHLVKGGLLLIVR